MSCKGLLQVVQNLALFQTKRTNHLQHSLKKPAAPFGLAAKGRLSQQHRTTQRNPGCVVGQHHSRCMHIGSQCFIHRLDVGAERRYLFVGTFMPQRLQLGHPQGQRRNSVRDGLCQPAPVQTILKTPFPVGPINLPLRRRHPAVGGVPWWLRLPQLGKVG